MIWNLTLLHLKTMLKKTPVQLLLIVLTQVFAVLCILIAYGFSQNIFQKQEQETEFINRWFEVNLTPWQENADGSYSPVIPLTIAETDAMIEAFLPEIEDILSYYSVSGFAEADGTDFSLTGVDMPSAADETSLAKHISLSDYEQGRHLVQVSYRNYPCSVGDMLTIGGETYEVVETDKASSVGIFAYDFSMPYRAFPRTAEITTVSFVLKEPPSSEQAEKIAARIQQYFGMETEVTLPVIPDLAEQQFNRLAVLICATIGVLVILNVSMVYLYALRQRRQMLGIYCLCGCTPQTALAMFICEWVLVLSLCYGTAWLLFHKLLLPWLCTLLEGLDFFYIPQVYLTIFGLYLLFSVCLLTLGCSRQIQQDTAMLVKEVS